MVLLYNILLRNICASLLPSLKPRSVNLLHTLVYNMVMLLGKAGQGQIYLLTLYITSKLNL